MSTLAMPVHVALVDETGTIGVSNLADVAAALNAQIQRDFAPVWKVAATVGAYPKAPVHTWAIYLRNDIGDPGALGYHDSEHHQPYSLVDADAGDWTITASHELLEMLADPWGNRMHTALSPEGVGNRRKVRYLLEVCDPPEAHSYEIGGVEVSDFLFPQWYRTVDRAGVTYDFTGALLWPRSVDRGGYVSYCNPDGEWFQAFNRNGVISERSIGRFGRMGREGSLRQWTDHMSRRHRHA